MMVEIINCQKRLECGVVFSEPKFRRGGRAFWFLVSFTAVYSSLALYSKTLSAFTLSPCKKVQYH